MTEEEKTGSIDLQATIDGKIVDIELQVKDEKNIEKRSTFYASKIMSRTLQKGEAYIKIPELIMINILDFNFINNENYHNQTITVLKNNREYEINNVIKYHYIELPKFRKKKSIDINNRLEQWLSLFDENKKERLEKVMEVNTLVKKAYEKKKYLTGEAAERRMADLREKWEHDYSSAIENAKEDGHEKGKIIGMKEGIKKVAKNMVKNGIEINQISKLTGLSKEEIKNIK